MKKIFFIAAIIFCSCSSQRRFNRLIERHPELLTTDSVTVHDTIRLFIPEVKVDTIVDVKELLDTIFLEKEQLKVKVWMDREKKVYIQGQCDTVYIDKIITRKIPVKYYEKTPVWKKILNILITLAIVLILLYLLYRFTRKYFTNF